MLYLLLLTGCFKKVTIRDAQVYKAEIQQWDNWAVKQSELMKGFMVSSCTCKNETTFNEKECNLAADYILTIDARSEWHKQKALSLAELGPAPADTPPSIPEITCPLK